MKVALSINGELFDVGVQPLIGLMQGVAEGECGRELFERLAGHPDGEIRRLARRLAAGLCEEMAESGSDTSDQPEEGNAGIQLHDISDLMLDNYRTLERLYSLPELIGFPWEQTRQLQFGMPNVDEMTGGMRTGEIVALGTAGDSDATAFALSVIAKLLSAADVTDMPARILILSQSRTAGELSMRLLSIISQVGYDSLRCGRFGAEEWRQLAAASGTLAESRLIIVDDDTLRVEQIHEICSEVAGKRKWAGIDLIWVDGMQFVGQFVEQKTRDARMAQLSEVLRESCIQTGAAALISLPFIQDIMDEDQRRAWSDRIGRSVDTVLLLDRVGEMATLRLLDHNHRPPSMVDLVYDRYRICFDSPDSLGGAC